MKMKNQFVRPKHAAKSAPKPAWFVRALGRTKVGALGGRLPAQNPERAGTQGKQQQGAGNERGGLRNHNGLIDGGF